MNPARLLHHVSVCVSVVLIHLPLECFVESSDLSLIHCFNLLNSLRVSACARLVLIAIWWHLVSFHALVTNSSEAIIFYPFLSSSLPLSFSFYLITLVFYFHSFDITFDSRTCVTKQSPVISSQLDAMKRVTCVTLAFTLPWCMMMNDIFSYILAFDDNEHHSSHRGRGWSTQRGREREREEKHTRTQTTRAKCQVFSSLHLTWAGKRRSTVPLITRVIN